MNELRIFCKLREKCVASADFSYIMYTRVYMYPTCTKVQCAGCCATATASILHANLPCQVQNLHLGACTWNLHFALALQFAVCNLHLQTKRAENLHSRLNLHLHSRHHFLCHLVWENLDSQLPYQSALVVRNILLGTMERHRDVLLCSALKIAHFQDFIIRVVP